MALSLFTRAHPVTTTAEHWHLNILQHGKQLIGAAMDELHDANAAHLMVHDVVYAAMLDLLGPVSRCDLDTALGSALRLQRANGAAMIA